MRQTTRRLLTAALAPAFGLALAGPALALPGSKIFRDWTAGCDNLKSCTALSLPADGLDDFGYLKLERPGGPGSAVTLSLKLRSESFKAPLSAQLSLDGAPFPAGGKPLPATLGDVQVAVIDFAPADRDTLIEAARKAAKLTAVLAGKRYEISLAGSVAALLWIDEQQGRLGATSALIRKGATTAIPAAPTMPVVVARATDALPAPDAKATKTLTTALRRHLKQRDPDACEDFDAGTQEAGGAWALHGGLRLVGLLCSRGAYNMTMSYWTLPGSDAAQARKVAFPQPDGSAPENFLVNGEYEPTTGQFSFFNKGRGIGDCGSNGGYAWTGTGFVLTSFTGLGACRGLIDDWLPLWRSEVKVAK